MSCVSCGARGRQASARCFWRQKELTAVGDFFLEKNVFRAFFSGGERMCKGTTVIQPRPFLKKILIHPQ